MWQNANLFEFKLEINLSRISLKSELVEDHISTTSSHVSGSMFGSLSLFSCNTWLYVFQHVPSSLICSHKTDKITFDFLCFLILWVSSWAALLARKVHWSLSSSMFSLWIVSSLSLLSLSLLSSDSLIAAWSLPTRADLKQTMQIYIL